MSSFSINNDSKWSVPKSDGDSRIRSRIELNASASEDNPQQDTDQEPEQQNEDLPEEQNVTLYDYVKEDDSVSSSENRDKVTQKEDDSVPFYDNRDKVTQKDDACVQITEKTDKVIDTQEENGTEDEESSQGKTIKMVDNGEVGSANETDGAILSNGEGADMPVTENDVNDKETFQTDPKSHPEPQQSASASIETSVSENVEQLTENISNNIKMPEAVTNPAVKQKIDNSSIISNSSSQALNREGDSLGSISRIETSNPRFGGGSALHNFRTRKR